MGIPNFFSRVREYGRTDEIGRRTTPSFASQSKSQSTNLAIIDGPSLAHYLFEQLDKEELADQRTQCFYRYAVLGEKAIKWLDNLRSFGFEIEGIYFDGALPSSKRQTRLERLQRNTNNLIKYKQKRARYAESVSQLPFDTTLAYCYQSTNAKEREELMAAQKKLPPPPFLVAAVVEALLQSNYGPKTWVVRGEADGFCAAAAFKASWNAYRSKVPLTVSIFTNDSDLIIWNTGHETKIVMIRSIQERNIDDERSIDDMRIMEAFQFAPDTLAKLRPDLVKLAFRMLDPKVKLLDAGEDRDFVDNPVEFQRFAASFDCAYSYFRHFLLQKEREDMREVLIQDPRISELIVHYLWALHKSRQRKAQKGSIESAQEQKVLDISESDGTTKRKREAYSDVAQVAQEPIDPFESNEEDTMQLEMFLPMLLEDPAKSAAWRIGESFRNAAETILMLPFNEYNTKVSEYKRSGDKIIPRQVKRVSIKRLREEMRAYHHYTRNALLAAKNLNKGNKWRFMVMQWTLSDMYQVENIREDRKHADVKDIIKIVNGNASSSWNTIHLFARYQAEYYSLRMFKDIFAFCRNREEFKRLDLPGSLNEFAAELRGLPGIAEFFTTIDPDVDEEMWQKLHAQFVEMQEEKEKEK